MRLKFYSIVATLVMGQFAFPMVRLDAADWPNWRGPDHNGISSEVDWEPEFSEAGPSVRWQANVGVGYSSVAVRAGRVVTMGNQDNRDVVSCLDETTGEPIWTHTYPSPLDARFFEGGPTSTPTVDADRVYSLGRQGDLYCLDVHKGVVLWSTDVAEETGARIPGWGFASSPRILGQRILLNVGDAGMAIDKVTGEVLWKSDTGEAGYMTPVVFDWQRKPTALVASGKFYSAVDIESGQVLWQHRWLTRFGANAADPIVHGDRIFLSSGYNRGSACLRMQLKEPKEIWKTKEFQNQFSSSVRIGGHLYGIDGDTTSQIFLKCLDFSTGEVVWSEPWEKMGALMAAGDKLIILSEQGELATVLATSKQYQLISRAAVLSGPCWTVPVLANGAVYCRNASGDLIAVEVRRTSND